MSARRKVLIGQFRYHPDAEAHLRRLEEAGFEVVYNRLGRKFTEDDQLHELPGCFATIASGEPFTARVLAAAAPHLKIIGRWGVGYDKIDVAACTRHGVAVAMSFGANHEAVADLAFTLLAALACDIKPVHALVAGGGWNAPFHRTIWGATVGLVGLGRIGKAMAKRCQGFQMRILACNSAPDHAWAAREGVEIAPFDALLRESDFVSLHAPHTPETENLIRRETLALMKPGAFLINTARGALVDEAALREALAGGRLAGAGLDVFRDEPPAGSPLLGFDGNVLFAPHWGSQTGAADAACARICVDAVLAVARGERVNPDHLLNPEIHAR